MKEKDENNIPFEEAKEESKEVPAEKSDSFGDHDLDIIDEVPVAGDAELAKSKMNRSTAKQFTGYIKGWFRKGKQKSTNKPKDAKLNGRKRGWRISNLFKSQAQPDIKNRTKSSEIDILNGKNEGLQFEQETSERVRKSIGEKPDPILDNNLPQKQANRPTEYLNKDMQSDLIGYNKMKSVDNINFKFLDLAQSYNENESNYEESKVSQIPSLIKSSSNNNDEV
jgi:hypothetical protein